MKRVANLCIGLVRRVAPTRPVQSLKPASKDQLHEVRTLAVQIGTTGDKAASQWTSKGEMALLTAQDAEYLINHLRWLVENPRYQ